MSGDKETAPRSRYARALIAYLTESVEPTFARLEEVNCNEQVDILDVVVLPQLPQVRIVPILHEEPIRLIFCPFDERAPSIFSRRSDFPLDEVHTSYETTSNGRGLCIWEANWAELRRGLSPQALTERIRDWFARTARGELHQEGQSLEPLIPTTANTLILPAGTLPDTCYVQNYIEGEGRCTIVLGVNKPKGDMFVPFALFARTVEAQTHGALHRRPTTLAELQMVLEPMGQDIAKAFCDWTIEHLNGDDKMAILLVAIPKKSEADGEVKEREFWAFSPQLKLHELSEQLGLAERAPDGTMGVVLVDGSPNNLDKIKLHGWRVVQRLDRRTAREYSGNHADEDARLVGIGAGAIGSNVMANTVRAGVGTWTVVDDDVLLPHNIVRQAQTQYVVGRSKAETEQELLDGILGEGGCASIVANILYPGEQCEAIEQVFTNSDLVADFSASPAVLGYLADAEPVKRVASFFFNPDGSDLIVLAEDGERTLRIDEIEAQYFLATGVMPTLSEHLDAARVDLLRYANACADLTRPLPPWQVQMLSGIAAGQLISLLSESEKPSAKLWRLDAETGCVETLKLALSNVTRHKFSDFRVAFSCAAVDTMRTLREEASPNETGGVLLGSYDLSRSVIHILDALPAPSDSRQSPTYFVRGAKHLKPLVDKVNLRSAGSIHYVGEWHSHPDGVLARPSNDDEKVFKNLESHLATTGTPFVMAICGKDETWFRAGWQGCETSEGTVSYDRG